MTTIEGLGIFSKYDLGSRGIGKNDSKISEEEFIRNEGAFCADYISAPFAERKNILSKMTDKAINALRQSLRSKNIKSLNPQQRQKYAKTLIEVALFGLLKGRNLKSMTYMDRFDLAIGSSGAIHLTRKFNDYYVFLRTENPMSIPIEMRISEQGEVIKLDSIDFDSESQKTVSFALWEIRATIAEDLRIAYSLPKLTPKDIAEQNRAAAKRVLLKKYLKEVVKPMRTRIRGKMNDQPGAIEVGPKEYTITRPGEGRSPYIETFGIGPCVALVLYDPTTKTGMVAHFMSTTMVKSLDVILAKLKTHGVDPKNIQARIIGGQNDHSEKIIYDIRDGLDYNDISIVEQDILGDIHEARSIILDTRTGEVYDYNETTSARSKDEWSCILLFAALDGPLEYYDRGNGFK
ncbi:hypothetical protein A2291_05265 [candidate division WOR-1 bacterium RIFOXYB2_FULL_42_35]|uniref:Uncharacterized protein n=1 Tax=candidate division WOR-1 bacterium RIFOXYC2_FULL_41_25 TaxID=1802586 RepID=A0A1F4TN62_UNCSA|nr:MAG: hypothetical protein A2247_00685 [candidate division WOR-1 bacterium RIFOXYA2_FULL_41_14]OGC24510.1 MAG: hypothetical protein A2291_05265 [candidate division WOR-1 bacterium RIFOXYB2_FULL_42_35]OGC34126.1 MAG: hypothetical protein A2462_01125 [candidate division WOR-1 bacterium RIFOXYC2_FULL_41_25]OGC42819.1 MAG: hypothetical protein A2548_00745 [candidate division WOR-1 bacterium RIFOXYD2_FULL_41_8]